MGRIERQEAMIKILFLFMLTFAQSAEAKFILDCDVIRNNEKVCLACNLYHEARGEADSGIIAVALVILNRVQSVKYPNSICKVVWQESQFSWTGDGKIDRIYNSDKWLNSLSIAKLMLDKKIEVRVLNIDSNVLWYHRYDIETNWSNKLKVVAVIGNHKFFRKK